MMLSIDSKRIIFICLIVILGLSGCFKSDIAVNINPNGSGTISVSAGMTDQAQILASDQGADPLKGLEETLSSRIGAAITGIEVKRWKDGDYDWVSVAKSFSSLEEINQALVNSTLFNRFSLTRKPGIFQDEFILDAELPALSSVIPPEYTLVDTSEYIQMSFSARLPGKIAESNGSADAGDPNRIVWDIPLSQAVTVKARSLVWNWFNIFGILAAAIGFAVTGVYAAILFIRRRNTATK